MGCRIVARDGVVEGADLGELELGREIADLAVEGRILALEEWRVPGMRAGPNLSAALRCVTAQDPDGTWISRNRIGNQLGRAYAVVLKDLLKSWNPFDVLEGVGGTVAAAPTIFLGVDCHHKIQWALLILGPTPLFEVDFDGEMLC